MGSELDALLRKLKPGKRQTTLARRPDHELPFADPDQLPPGTGLLLDSCVYLDGMAERLPDSAAKLLVGRPLHHSTICLAELGFGLGALRPADPRTRASRRALEDVIARILGSPRLHAPDQPAWLLAGTLSGLLARLQGYGPEQRRRAIMDSLLLATARRLGLTLLTANLAEFDPMLQLLPDTKLVFYRRS